MALANKMFVIYLIKPCVIQRNNCCFVLTTFYSHFHSNHVALHNQLGNLEKNDYCNETEQVLLCEGHGSLFCVFLSEFFSKHLKRLSSSCSERTKLWCGDFILQFNHSCCYRKHDSNYFKTNALIYIFHHSRFFNNIEKHQKGVIDWVTLSRSIKGEILSNYKSDKSSHLRWCWWEIMNICYLNGIVPIVDVINYCDN